jgi:regulator of sigma E protease
MNIIVALLIFSLIVVIHELGHFLLAVKNGIFVTEFSIGMGPRIVTLVKTEKGYRPRLFLNQHDFETTEEWKDSIKYSIKLLPLGGSCMMLGEDELCEDNRAFNKKGVWARISVILAGPLFNFIFAFILALFITGIIGYDPAVIIDVKNGSPAAEAGLQAGDVITNFNGRKISISRELDSYFAVNPLTQEEVKLTYKRDGEKNTVILTPIKTKTYWLGFGYEPGSSKMKITSLYEDRPMAKAGIQIGDIITNINGADIKTGLEFNEYMKLNPLEEKPIQLTYLRDGVSNTITVHPELYSDKYSLGTTINSARVKTDVLDTIKYSAVEVKFMIVSTIDGLSQMIRGKVSPDQIAGPVGIFNIIGDTYEESKQEGVLSVFLNLSYISLLLSANLGVMNLLPIPALDGGRLVFLFLEVLRGKPISQTKEGFVHMIGLIALMLLMLFVFFNDISRLF